MINNIRVQNTQHITQIIEGTDFHHISEYIRVLSMLHSRIKTPQTIRHHQNATLRYRSLF